MNVPDIRIVHESGVRSPTSDRHVCPATGVARGRRRRDGHDASPPAAAAAAAVGTGASATDTLTIALDADAAPNGYDPLLYSQGQFQFFSRLYDALFVTDSRRQGRAQPGRRIHEQRRQHQADADSQGRRHLHRRLDAGLHAGQGEPRPAQRHRTSPSTARSPRAARSEITDVAAPDAKTVVITWAQPQATRRSNLADEAGVIVGTKGVADPGVAGDHARTAPARTRWTPARPPRAAPTPWPRTPRPGTPAASPYNTVVFKVITDPQALANAVVSGQADVGGAARPDHGRPGQVQAELVKNGGTIVGFPVPDKTGATNPAFAKVEVRLALMLRDRPRDDRQGPAPGRPAPPRSCSREAAAGFDPALDTEYAYDPAKAKQLLAEAGYPNGFSFDLTVLGQPNDDQIAIQKQWEEIGVKLNFVTATSTDAALRRGAPPRRWSSARSRSATRPASSPGVALRRVHEPAEGHRPGDRRGAGRGARRHRCRPGSRADGPQRRDHRRRLVHPGLRGLHLLRLQRQEGRRSRPSPAPTATSCCPASSRPRPDR